MQAQPCASEHSYSAQVVYCSPACRDADPFHQPQSSECAVPWPRVLPEDAVLAVRMAVLQARLEHQQPQVQLQAQAQGLCEMQAPVQSLPLALLQQLEDHLDGHASTDPQLVLAWCVQATLAADAYTQCAGRARAGAGGSETGPGKAAGSGSATAVSERDVLRWLARITVNGVALKGAASGGSADRWGLALFPAAALLNHSCDPNVTLR